MGVEFVLFIGRTISQSLFILMAFIDIIYVIPIFIIFLILLMINSVKLQKYISKNIIKLKNGLVHLCGCFERSR